MNALSSLNRVAAFVVRSLPDSLEERKEILTDVMNLMPAQHPLRIQISELINGLELHERCQMQLALDFKKRGSAAVDGDGEGKKGAK